MTVLSRILEAKRARLVRGELAPRGEARLPSDGARFLAALRRPGARVIAELKHRSPSAGVILPEPGRALPAVADDYRRGGAAAISVVVEQDYFGGDPAWLPEVKRLSGLPVLMKDFVIDEVQLDLALSLGADAVLLIASALDDTSLARLHAAARERGLAVLVEAHGEAEVERVARVGAGIVGINARDLSTFQVDLQAMARAASGLPREAVRVAESGIGSRADVVELQAAGFGAFLVGESLLRAPDRARALRELQGLGTTEVKVCGVTREEDVDACRDRGVDWIGFNFSARSPRRVSLSRALELRSPIRTVAVFAGNGETEIRDVVEALRPDVIQLTDPPGERRWPGRVWQTVRVGRDALDAACQWPGEALLFDTAVNGVSGGTGRTFDWTVLGGLTRDRPFVLAGGLTAENVAGAIRAARPDVVDTASGVESARGIKDHRKIAAFVAAVREAS